MSPYSLYSVRGLERSELGGSHGFAQGAFGTDFYDMSILRPTHRAYYRSGRPAIKIGPKGALGSHEIRPIHSVPSLGQSIDCINLRRTLQYTLTEGKTILNDAFL